MEFSDLARELDAYEAVDISDFQRRARVLQSLWRQKQHIPPGEHRSSGGSRPLGSRLPMPDAEERLLNFLTETIREVVRLEVCDPERSAGKLYGKPRIFNDLLSSQPLCFNLFGELTRDLGLASRLFDELTHGRMPQVVAIEFEESPGRRDPRYLNDRSAFDVFVRCLNSRGASCFVGIEVKYHENLIGTAGEHKLRYDEVADLMGCFRQDRTPLHRSPLQQIWRDHLLTGITQIEDSFSDALFVTLFPQENPHVSGALKLYEAELASSESFAGWTLEHLVETLHRLSSAPWIAQFADRYLAFDKIDLMLEAADWPGLPPDSASRCGSKLDRKIKEVSCTTVGDHQR